MSNLLYYITTPMFYVNAAPHIGHVYSAVLADAACRLQRLLCPSVSATTRHLLVSGTDEHGLKIQRAAGTRNMTPRQLCDHVSPQFRHMLAAAGVDCGVFVRTTEPQHRDAVLHFWDRLFSAGYIVKSVYSGWYCESDETFLSKSQTVEETTGAGNEKVVVSAESGHEAVWTQEENYVFQLSRMQTALCDWASNDDVVRPAKFLNQLRSWLTEPLPDLSVSRPASRLTWGIPVPGDDTQVIYVWLDALVSYLSAVGYPHHVRRWPADCHIIGKDILRFHGVYWPAMLMAAGLAPPASIMCHSHWTVDGRKMSKSLGNVVSATDALRLCSGDALRYVLLRNGTPHSDNNFSESTAVAMLNAELADTLGNLLARCCSSSVNPRQCVPSLVHCDVTQHCGPLAVDLVTWVRSLPDTVLQHYRQFNFYLGLEAIQRVLHMANKFIDDQKPWKLCKHVEHEDQLRCCLAVAMETLRVSGILLQPVVPSLATHLLDKLGVDASERGWNCAVRISDNTTVDCPLGNNSAVIFNKLR